VVEGLRLAEAAPTTLDPQSQGTPVIPDTEAGVRVTQGSNALSAAVPEPVDDGEPERLAARFREFFPGAG
jgi:hypothetical protein